MMKYALIITGILAGLALAAPKLVVLGYILLVVPGLVLTCAPTVFVYLAATAGIRRLLPNSSSVASTVTAFCIAIALGWIVMQPFRRSAIASYDANRLPDVIPQQPIRLDGHVRLEIPDRRDDPQCDYLCLAALDSPDVQSVSLVTAGKNGNAGQPQPKAYALVSAQEDPAAGIFPFEPGQIVREFPPLAKRFAGRNFIEAVQSVEANWALRLTQDERLRHVEPVAADAADWVIRIENQSNGRTSRLRRLTITDAAGTVHYRQSYRTQAVPARTFYVGFDVHFGGGTISGASFHVGRQQLAEGELSLQPEKALLSAITFPVPRCDPEDLTRLREQVEQALNDPNATAVRLDLARCFLRLFYFNTKPQDHDLIARIVADDRVRNIDEQLRNVFSKDETPVVVRDAFAQRIVMEHTSADLRHRLAECLASLPPGTFSEPDESHLKIWETPEIYQDAAPFLERVADLDPQRAVPMLQAALATAIELPTWQARRSLVEGIRAALVRMGPQASMAAAQIQELFLSRPSPIMQTSKDADQWRFALARMGLELDELPMFPTQSSDTANRIRSKVAMMLQRYEQDLAAKEIR